MVFSSNFLFQILILRDERTIKSDSIFVFGQAFFKRLGGAAALGGRASQGAK